MGGPVVHDKPAFPVTTTPNCVSDPVHCAPDPHTCTPRQLGEPPSPSHHRTPSVNNGHVMCISSVALARSAAAAAAAAVYMHARGNTAPCPRRPTLLV